MRAVIRENYGEAENVLRLAQAGPRSATARCCCACTQPAWTGASGISWPACPMRCAWRGTESGRPRPPCQAREVAGRVEAVGGDVTLAVGDEVFGIAGGSFAEYARARADKLAPRPSNLTFAQAAAVPVSGLTALQAVRDRGHVQAGQQVLVIGASGGVGTFAVQIAKAYGADVTGVCSTAKADMVRSIGADRTIDYTREDIADGGHRYDVILDTGGNRPLRQLRRALTPRGTLVIIGGETDGRWLGGSDRQLRAVMLSPFTSQHLSTLLCSENKADLTALTEMVESGQVTPVIDKVYPLSETIAAIRYMRDGHARGKVVITFHP